MLVPFWGGILWPGLPPGGSRAASARQEGIGGVPSKGGGETGFPVKADCIRCGEAVSNTSAQTAPEHRHRGHNGGGDYMADSYRRIGARRERASMR